MLQRWGVVVAAGALVLIASCGGTDTNAAPAPFHAVPEGAQVVWGSVSCRDAPEDEELALVCALDMSDPRVSGTEVIEQFRTITPGQWVFDTDVITNAEGTWRGSAQGSDDIPGNPIGEAHLVGEGGYAGLEFHYYLTEPILGEGALLRGWISEAAPDDTPSAVTPFHAVADEAIRVSGYAACDTTGSGTGELDALVTCHLNLSDPKVTGTETQDGFSILAGDVGSGDVRAADDARITTTKGTWRGRVQVATDDAAVPAAIGEAHYIGEGAYEGLEFHYYFGPADLDIAEGGLVAVHGWISPAP